MPETRRTRLADQASSREAFETKRDNTPSCWPFKRRCPNNQLRAVQSTPSDRFMFLCRVARDNSSSSSEVHRDKVPLFAAVTE